jgi:hypothetical protein
MTPPERQSATASDQATGHYTQVLKLVPRQYLWRPRVAEPFFEAVK